MEMEAYVFDEFDEIDLHCMPRLEKQTKGGDLRAFYYSVLIDTS
jgi:hypothetical protein